MRIKVDLHNHTNFSFDGEMNPRRFVEVYTRLGFGAVAVTDHNTRLGALAVAELDPPFRVIVSCEVKSREGEIIGLFLDRDIPRGLSAIDTAKAIHDAGGLTLLPHPMIDVVPTRIDPRVLPAVLEHIDIIECVNARNADPAFDRDAALVANAYGKARGAGSDAHAISGAGTGYVLMEPFDGPADFLEKLHRGTIVARKREAMARSLVNFAYGNTLGQIRVGRMIRAHRRGVPLRRLWDRRAPLGDKTPGV
ncbi:PHP domain-containing protein [bacterium]|nr:PHP domain-containing protein [bacterium]